MKSTLRRVSMPDRLDAVPKPVALRYVNKDAQGHTRICARMPSQEHREASLPVLQQGAASSKEQA